MAQKKPRGSRKGARNQNPSQSESQLATDPAGGVGATPVVVGMGASAGGIEALQKFFDAAPRDSGLAFAVVLHLAPDQSSALAQVLARHTAMPVREVRE
ncbi:MAG TPA: chemotaxis protein CheB, partial [Planctomycetaceae bacterium]|nr:chemotaxis protein CheB [Planctomycetaceae bacterium]